eukprot:Hpha_TRINITY_DN16148_c1_g1::TRINITY_DN16148_c1_g1_i1::g.3147::m.3147
MPATVRSRSGRGGDQEAPYRREDYTSRQGRRATAPAPAAGGAFASDRAALAFFCLFVLPGGWWYIRRQSALESTRTKSLTMAKAGPTRGFFMIGNDGAWGEDPDGREAVNGESWVKALYAPVLCKSPLSKQCADPPLVPVTSSDDKPELPSRTPAPAPKDHRPKLCCERDYEATCPVGWLTVGKPGFRVTDVQWRYRGKCKRLVPRAESVVTEATTTYPVRCSPGPDYKGPCKEFSPPCDPEERRRWAQLCSATWPCAKEVLHCEWTSCSPKCYYGSLSPPPAFSSSCAPDQIVQPLTVVTPFPSESQAAQMTPERRLEYVNTLRCNIAHPHVGRIHLLLEATEEEVAVRQALQDARSPAEKLKGLWRLWKEQGVLSQEGFDRWKKIVLQSTGNGTLVVNTQNVTLSERLDRFVMGGTRTSGLDCAPLQDRCEKVRVHPMQQSPFLYSDALRFISEREGLQERYFLLTRPDVSVGDGFGDYNKLNRLVPPGHVAALTPYEDVSCTAIDTKAAAESDENDDLSCDCRTNSGDCGYRSYLFRTPLPKGIAQASLTPLPTPEQRGQVVQHDNGLLQWAGVHVDADLPYSGSPGADAIFLEVLRYHGLFVEARCGIFEMRRHRCHALVQKRSPLVSLHLQRRPVGPFPAPPIHVRLARWWTRHNTSWPLHAWRHSVPQVEGSRRLTMTWYHSDGWYGSAVPRTVPADILF